MTTVGGPEALHRPGVRAGLNRYRRSALLFFLGGCALLIGFCSAAIRVEDDAAELERTGYRVPGEVVAVHAGMKTPGSIDVAYRYLDVAHQERVNLDSESPEYQVSDQVTVLIDRHDLDHVTVLGETNQSPLTVWPMVAALLLGCVAAPSGAASLVRVHRQRKLLAAEPWRRMPARYREVPRGRGEVQGVILIEEGRTLRIFTVARTLRRRLRRAGLRDGGDIELVGDVGGRIVVRAVGGPVVLSAKRPRRAGARRRWLRQAFPDRRR